ncbi:MAG: 50S ribosomal protein L4 [Candidatus Woesebacteria bacterium GW2011_GWA1_39_21]|uniref:Large ribosomal subunit protein uL4 n=1 Tax=Candidatus Woesebacteria bacterium GW2011_GWA1_39_21 TaxID=1618550 RepID=A0A0G0N7Z9_9BACT|nr:MAG: 50S ribosomal protein L4 [Candidatus Woesebacteria bacterium GW2011_GWA1_39_21]
MLKVDLYDHQGKKKESITLPKDYAVKANSKLLSQAVRVYEDRAHLGLSRTKTRGEVAISTRKIYRQKGTGGARHGAKSAPIFVGGGTAHGPKGIKRTLKLSKSIKNMAFLQAINYKGTDALALVDNLEKIEKTKDADKLIKNIVKEKSWGNGNVLVALAGENGSVAKAFRNIEGVVVDSFKNLNAYKIYLANALLVDNKALTEKTDKNASGANAKEGAPKRKVGFDNKKPLIRRDVNSQVRKTARAVNAKAGTNKRKAAGK